MSGEFTSGYLQEVTGDLDGPACTVCGAIMVPYRNMSLEQPCLQCEAYVRPFYPEMAEEEHGTIQ